MDQLRRVRCKVLYRRPTAKYIVQKYKLFVREVQYVKVLSELIIVNKKQTAIQLQKKVFWAHTGTAFFISYFHQSSTFLAKPQKYICYLKNSKYV